MKNILLLSLLITLGAGCASVDSVDQTRPTSVDDVEVVAPVVAEDVSVKGEGSFADLEFVMPPHWAVEHVSSIDALNLFVSEGEGTALDRSQIFIRYFDAKDFLTLATVEIYSKEELTVGADNYRARRYDIEKKSGVRDFANQPAWRNDRHIVTDFRLKDGYTRYYVVAANPDLDPVIYERLLVSMKIF